MSIVNNILIILLMAVVAVIFLFANDEGIKEIHDNVAVYVEKPKPVEEVEVTKEAPMYILQATKSI